ncbi:BCCT family transporter [Anaerotruncus colihominis]|uniref:BCCT family transporter n=1 Tax=Anaerotruncus colihominis TaxID=169435 RepID=UPI00189B399D|nr:BCCT family transporter [Anaerotruncus colihominis]
MNGKVVRHAPAIRKLVFWPPWILLVAVAVVSFINNESFLKYLNLITGWILNYFAWGFNGLALFCVITVIMVYFSPLGKVRIGGRKARPIMKYSNWLWITLCTTVAAGILFWACAEPLYHLYAPPAAAGVVPGTPEAALFSMEVMFLEWTWSPYALYAVATLAFAFAYYNMKLPNTLSAPLALALGTRVQKWSAIVDVICLFALTAGMAGSMGTGILSISGGLESVTGVKSAPGLWAVVGIVAGALFVVSSITGVMKGIKLLSKLNMYVFFLLLALFFLFGPTAFMLNTAAESLGAFFSDFFRLSLMTGDLFGDGWARSWPNFYFCNWLAWTPICAVFLGKIARGYTIRDAIRCNFFFPSIFSTLWIGLFSTASIFYEMNGGGLSAVLAQSGAESVVYAVLRRLPLSTLIIPLYIFIIFISFVTACDSNTSALSGLCVSEDADERQESPAWLKIVWGATITLIAWIMISSAGIDGIKAVSNLGGFPNMFLVLIMAAGLWRVSRRPGRFDAHKEDYDQEDLPLPSRRLTPEECDQKQQSGGAVS